MHRFKLEVGDVNRCGYPGEMLEAIYSYDRIHTALKIPLPFTLNTLPQTLVFINWVLDNVPKTVPVTLLRE
ncbi:MAG: hypothetical protein H6673_15750 [Anaerolineales bacterium]|nr:hypothetical protein [Anaerolineales bacterium]